MEFQAFELLKKFRMYVSARANLGSMKMLLTTTAIIEGITGLALAIMPPVVIFLLLGIPFTDPGAILIGRLAGAALTSIAITCWLLRSEPQSSVMIKVMLGYNGFSITLLLYAALVEGISGPALWPAVLFHFGLLVWCLSFLWKRFGSLFKPSKKMKPILNPDWQSSIGDLVTGVDDTTKLSARVVDMTNAGKSKYHYKNVQNAAFKN